MWARKVSIRKKAFSPLSKFVHETCRSGKISLLSCFSENFVLVVTRLFHMPRSARNKKMAKMRKCWRICPISRKWQFCHVTTNMNDKERWNEFGEIGKYDDGRWLQMKNITTSLFVSHRLRWNNLTRYSTASFLGIHVRMTLPTGSKNFKENL